MEDIEIEVYDRTKDSLLQLLDLNMPGESYLLACQQNPMLVWKVLVFDRLSGMILAPIVHVTDLHLHNVVLFLPLEEKREMLRSITVVYLIEPSVESVNLVVRDCKLGLYDQFQVNFLYPPSEVVVQMLAEGLSDNQSLGKVLKIYEQYLRYIVLEPNLVTLNGPSFLDLNSPGTSDNEIEDKLLDIGKSLFCLMKNCKFWPIIKHSKGLSEIVGSKLAELCWENTEESTSINRPLLLILDRTTDINIMLHHPWTYQALLLDVFKNNLNKIVLPSNPVQIKELDKKKDRFLSEQCFNEFDQVLQNIDKQFNEWKIKYDKIGDNLMSAFENVEELTEVKSQIDLHMMLATEIVKIVKSRHLDVFNSVEENLMKGSNVNLDEALGKSSECEEFNDDKLRLQIISYLSKNVEFDKGSSLFNYLRTNFKQSTVNESKLSTIYGKMKKFIGNDLFLPVTRIVHEALENKDDLGYFDSKFKDRPRYKGKFEEVLVFVVGGGCYAEYQNLMQYGKNYKKNILYACTAMHSPSEFLEQLKELAQRNQ